MPLATLRAVADHGNPREGLSDGDIAEARQLLDELAALGIDYQDVVATVEREGLRKFTASFNDITSLLRQKHAQVLAAPSTWRFESKGFGPYS
jgi:transaldolase